MFDQSVRYSTIKGNCDVLRKRFVVMTAAVS